MGGDGFLTGADRRPPDGHIIWRKGADGVRVRLAFWPLDDATGTIVLLPGRTEFIEKYGPAAREFAKRGFACASIDWRGQGLSDRLLDDPTIGHVDRFDDYQIDLAALMAEVQDQDMPEPIFLLGQSMGGAIGLRGLINGLTVRAAIFSAPLWGIHMSAMNKALVDALAGIYRISGQSHQRAPWSNRSFYATSAPFEGNLLTNDPKMWAFLRDTVRANPELEVAGPSCAWVEAALNEAESLKEAALPDIPTLITICTDEGIVDNAAAIDIVQRWATAKLIRYDNCQHEIMMEIPSIRKKFFDDCADFFNKHI